MTSRALILAKMFGRIRRHVTYAKVASTAALLFAMGGGAVAAANSIPGPGGVISACYSNGNGVLRVIRVGRKCSRGERSLRFNQTGQPGPRGAQGPAGVSGSPGPVTGPAGGDLTGNYPNPAIADGAVTQSKLAPAEGWHEIGTAGSPPFNGSGFVWRNFGGNSNTTAFFRDPYGVVHLKGRVKNVSGAPAAFIMFTFPPGYRPAAEETDVVDYNGTFGTVDVSPTGEVLPLGGAVPNGGFISLDGITFRCAPSGSDGCP